MKVLFHLGHPGHFHLFKNVISALKNRNHEILIVIKKKDVLEDLLIESDFSYTNILPSGRKNSKVGIAIGQFTQNKRIFDICRYNRPNLLIGTSVAISHVGRILNIPSFNFNEDDAKAVPLYSYLAYPWATKIISPDSCDNSHWQNKTIAYSGYHELSYLHPKYFSPNKNIVKKYLSHDKPYFILRFAKLTAHHDERIKGIDIKIAKKLILFLKSHGNIYITSERTLEPELEKYRLNINPVDIHHILAFTQMYIGDSQTMAAEAAVLGTPSIRYNDFVGKLGYLEELEHKYELTYGFKTSESEKMIEKIRYLIEQNKLKQQWEKKRQKMLSDKIDVTSFFVWLIENYPKSIKTLRNNKDYHYNFKQ